MLCVGAKRALRLAGLRAHAERGHEGERTPARTHAGTCPRGAWARGETDAERGHEGERTPARTHALRGCETGAPRGHEVSASRMVRRPYLLHAG